jgi:phosphatidate cytidylyltransferase
MWFRPDDAAKRSKVIMSSVWKRILSAVVIIPVVLWLSLHGNPFLFAAIVALLTLQALREYYHLSPVPISLLNRILGVILTLFYLLSFLPPTLLALPEVKSLQTTEVLFLSGLLLGLSALIDRQTLEKKTQAWIYTSFGLIYVALPLGLLIAIRFGFSLGVEGGYLLLFLLVPQWFQDTAAFFVGRRWGRHRMAPLISPKKSWEGALAGIIAAMLCGMCFHFWLFKNSDLSQILIFSFLLGAAGQASDLGESLIKRAVGVKDSSQIIPGHGGVLDRIDGLLFAAPCYWLLLRFWPIG